MIDFQLYSFHFYSSHNFSHPQRNLHTRKKMCNKCDSNVINTKAVSFYYSKARATCNSSSFPSSVYHLFTPSLYAFSLHFISLFPLNGNEFWISSRYKAFLYQQPMCLQLHDIKKKREEWEQKHKSTGWSKYKIKFFLRHNHKSSVVKWEAHDRILCCKLWRRNCFSSYTDRHVRTSFNVRK